jgi:CBS domain-containing protein
MHGNGSDYTPTDRINKIMTGRLAVVSDGASLRSIAAELTPDEIGAVIITSSGVPVGLISELDLVVVLGTGGDLDAKQAADVMVTDLVAAGPRDTITSVGRRMLDAGVRHVVIRQDDHVVGLVSMRDVLAALLGSADR